MTCAKQSTAAVLVTRTGQAFAGQNSARNPQKVCPREPGDGYAKCYSICQMFEHAEIRAIKAAERAGQDLRGAVLYLFGHCQPCSDCQGEMAKHGIAWQSLTTGGPTPTK